MSVIVASGEQISKSPLNKSLTKQMYSFPKAERFQKPLDKCVSSTFFYNIPSARSNRFTTLGKGKKFDFAKLNNNKCAEFYEMRTDFNPKKPNAPAFTFGISRSYYEKVLCDSNIKHEGNVPGPGKYEVVKKLGHEAPKFSLYGRIMDRISESSKVPGPGEYECVSTNPLGKFVLSNIKNTTNIIWGQSKEKRFNYSYGNNPSPANYNIKPLIDGTGKIYVSSFKSGMAKSILGKSNNNNTCNKNRWNTPGPGTYAAFSEFGIYRSKNADKFEAFSANKLNNSGEKATMQ